jgi:16S rRNA processing protein RimM
MRKDDCFELGHVVKALGTKGENVILLDVDEPQAYDQMESVFVEDNGNLVPFFIEHFQLQEKGFARVKFEEIEDRVSAEALNGSKLFLPLQALPALESDQFYYHDVVGYQVKDQEKGMLGVVESFVMAGNQDLMIMTYKEKEVLIPVMDEIILKAEHEAKIIEVKLPDGLLELYLEEE